VDRWRQVRAGARLTVVVGLLWAAFLAAYFVVAGVARHRPLGALLGWVQHSIPTLLGYGLVLGGAFVGVLVLARPRGDEMLSLRRAALLGAVSAALAAGAIQLISAGGASASMVLWTASPFAALGAIVGMGVHRIAYHRPRLLSDSNTSGVIAP
jgi:hypothetical protein